MNEALVWGRNSVIELLKSGRSINKILIAEGSREESIRKIFSIANSLGIITHFVKREKIDAVTNIKTHQGVVAFAAAVQYSTLEDILVFAERKKEPPFLILLDELEDPQNFGAILRTAEAVGVHGVIIPKRRNVQLNATVFKTSAGAAEYVKVAQINNVAQTLKILRENEIKIIGLDVNANKPFRFIELTSGLVLVIGNEGRGMRRLTREDCDELIKIPMVGKINSLNASVAGAILMYEVFSQRNKFSG